MTRRTYGDFDLWIQRIGDTYQARGRDFRGREAVVEFAPPFSAPELESLRQRLDLPPTRHARSRDDEPAKSFGARLFAAVFHGDLLSCFRASLEDTSEETMTGLRIRLRLMEVPELADLPWEYLYDKVRHRFIALSASTPLVRFLEMPEPIRPLMVRPPLRMLVMIASPIDHPALDVEGEWRRLNEALSGLQVRGLVALERLEGGTQTVLQHRLRRGEVHVLHFVGHGTFDTEKGEGELVLEDDTGRGRPINGEDLSVLLRDSSSLRLVVLNACEGASASRQNPFTGVAQALIRQGIPGVIAAQAEIRDDVALTWATEFYAALADGYPVDAAVAEARKGLSGRGRHEWGVLVLFLRAPDGILFDVAEKQRPGPKPRRGSGMGWFMRLVGKRMWLLPTLAALIAVLIFGLGATIQHGREGLLGLPETLSYSPQATFLSGAETLWWLPRYALFALFSGNRWLLTGSWGSLLLLVLPLVARRWLPAARKPMAMGVLLAGAGLVLLFALRFATAAVFPTRSDNVTGPEFDVHPARNLVKSTEFETVSWLKNDKQENGEHRQALGGLAFWLLLAACGSVFCAWKERELHPGWRWGLLIGHGLLAVLLASLIPRAYAVAAWGLEYPHVRVEKECDEELFRASTQLGCCVFDVSAGGRPRSLLLWGQECPGQGFRTWSEERDGCLTNVAERVISDDC